MGGDDRPNLHDGAATLAAPVSISGYTDYVSGLHESHAYLLPPILRFLGDARPTRLFDLGCGNGSVAEHFDARGWTVCGVDPSTAGIADINRRRPDLDLHEGSAYDPLADRFGRFPYVVSLEVVEHVYAPRRFAKTLHDLLEDGGTAFISTPYHGYWKNLAIAVSGHFDRHFTALWDDGHIKFWSVATLGALLGEAGLEVVAVARVGRVPALAKSMIMIVRRS